MSEICEVKEFCVNKGCESTDNKYINIYNCSCRECMKRSLEDLKNGTRCEWSGDAYNTDRDCLMLK